VLYLTRALEKDYFPDAAPLFSEDYMEGVLNLLVNAVDTNKACQEYMLQSFRLYDLIKRLLKQGIKLAGLGALFLSHVVWDNPNS